MTVEGKTVFLFHFTRCALQGDAEYNRLIKTKVNNNEKYECVCTQYQTPKTKRPHNACTDREEEAKRRKYRERKNRAEDGQTMNDLVWWEIFISSKKRELNNFYCGTSYSTRANDHKTMWIFRSLSSSTSSSSTLQQLTIPIRHVHSDSALERGYMPRQRQHKKANAKNARKLKEKNNKNGTRSENSLIEY